ncbi:MAG: carbohydrate binding family 9 domain-containing protein, partial [Proteobacteria bacterium]|nr:carbohydrate binding family 9 domain-containing protein [Pseudomonadota bacterium]
MACGRFIRLMLVFTLFASANICAQMVSSQGKSIDAFQVDMPPIIDGRLDDDAWAFATLVQDLHQVNPQEYDPPSEKSEIYVVYTRDALYIGARFLDSEPENISAQVLRQGDFSLGDDSFTVIIDPFNNGRSGYAFDLTPNSIRNQAVFANVTDENWQWDGIWHGKAIRDDKGWVAEIEIPFKTLSFNPNNSTW